MFLYIRLWAVRYFWHPKPEQAQKQDEENSPKKTWSERLGIWRHKRHNVGLKNAAISGHIWKAQQLIIRYHADPDYVDSDGMTPLLYAIDGGKDDMVRALMYLGASAAPVENGFKPYLNKALDTKDPLQRAIQSNLSSEAVQAIARRCTDSIQLQKIRRLLKQDPYGEKSIEAGELVLMAVCDRIKKLRMESDSVSNVTKISAVQNSV